MTMTRSESILLQMQQDSRTNNICFHDQSFAHGLHHGQSSNRRASEPTSLVNNGNDKEETTQMIGVLSYSSNPYLATPKAILSETNSSPQRPAASSLSNSIAQSPEVGQVGHTTTRRIPSSSSTSRRFQLRSGQLGAIRLSLLINPSLRELLVTVLEARDLPSLGADNSDMFVKATLCSDHSKSARKRSRTARGSASPRWDETLTPLRISRDNVSDEILRVQVIADNSNSVVGETYVPLDRTLRAFPSKFNAWFPLQPIQNNRRRVGPKWLKRNTDQIEPDCEAGAFLSFLNAQLNETEEQELDTEIEQHLTLRGLTWSQVVPEMASLESRDEKFANALWELFTTEVMHMSVLAVLLNPFQRVLHEIKNNKMDTRVRCFPKECKLDRIFAHASNLFRISLRFVRVLYDVLVARADRLRKRLQNTPEKSKTVTYELLDINPIIDAFEELRISLMDPELQYRLQHEKARRYITRLSTDDSDGPFALYVQWCQEDPRCERHSLIDLITQPLQRLTRYPLLLKAILKYMSGRNPNRSRFEQQLELLTDAIDEHDRKMQWQDKTNKLRKLQNALVWPSAIELSENQKVSREHLFEGWLTPLSGTGKELPSVFVAIVGDLLILAKPYHESSQPAIWRRSTVDDKTFVRHHANMANSSDEDDDEDKLMVEEAHHLVDIAVLDVEDQTAVVKNCFSIIFMSPFNTPQKVITLKTSTSVEKSEWLGCLRDGITSAETARETFHSKGRNAMSRNESSTVLQVQERQKQRSDVDIAAQTPSSRHHQGQRQRSSSQHSFTSSPLSSPDVSFRFQTSDNRSDNRGGSCISNNNSDHNTVLIDSIPVPLRRKAIRRHQGCSSSTSEWSSSGGDSIPCISSSSRACRTEEEKPKAEGTVEQRTSPFSSSSSSPLSSHQRSSSKVNGHVTSRQCTSPSPPPPSSSSSSSKKQQHFGNKYSCSILPNKAPNEKSLPSLQRPTSADDARRPPVPVWETAVALIRRASQENLLCNNNDNTVRAAVYTPQPEDNVSCASTDEDGNECDHRVSIKDSGRGSCGTDIDSTYFCDNPPGSICFRPSAITADSSKLSSAERPLVGADKHNEQRTNLTEKEVKLSQFPLRETRPQVDRLLSKYIQRMNNEANPISYEKAPALQRSERNAEVKETFTEAALGTDSSARSQAGQGVHIITNKKHGHYSSSPRLLILEGYDNKATRV